MNLKGAVCIVTGAGTGTGAACAVQLARKGCRVVVNFSKSEAEARSVVDACIAAGTGAIAVKGNVAIDADCRALAKAALDKWGRIDALINNAGITKFAAATDLDGLDAEDFQRIYAVNVIGPYQMTRAVAPAMQKQGSGSVVNVSSLAGVRGVGSSIAYAASKGALNNMTMSLARALGPEIRVNTVCPGFIDTRWLRTGLGDETFEKLRASVAKANPLKEASTPAEVAEPIVYFALSARHTTGETLLVDAGTHLGASMRVER